MIKSVVIESGSCGEVAADQELPSYQVLAALVVSLRGELSPTGKSGMNRLTAGGAVRPWRAGS